MAVEVTIANKSFFLLENTYITNEIYKEILVKAYIPDKKIYIIEFDEYIADISYQRQ